MILLLGDIHGNASILSQALGIAKFPFTSLMVIMMTVNDG